GCAQLPPSSSFSLQLLSAAFRKVVILSPATVLRYAPVGFDPAPALESVQRRIQRALLHLKNVARNLLNALGDGPAVLGFERQRFQNEEIQCALRQVNAFVHHFPLLLLQNQTLSCPLSKCKGEAQYPCIVI